MRNVLAFLWRSSKRGVVIVAGFGLLLGGVAMLVLPGPGLLVIIAGLAVLAREFVWAERALEAAKRRATQGADAVKGGLRRGRRRATGAPATADELADAALADEIIAEEMAEAALADEIVAEESAEAAPDEDLGSGPSPQSR